MLIQEYIKKQVNEKFSNLPFEDQENLTQLSLYTLAKKAPYFGDRYEILRMAKTEYYNSEKKDGKPDRSRTLGFGFKKLNNIKNHTNETSEKWLFDNEYGRFNFQFLISDEDITILKEAFTLLEKSKDFKSFVNILEEKEDEDKSFLYRLHHLLYSNQDGYKNEDLFSFTHSFLEKINDEENEILEDKYKMTIYRGNIHFNPSNNKFITTLKKEGLKAAKKLLTDHDKKIISLAKEGHKIAQKNEIYIYLNSDTPDKEYVNATDYKLTKFKTKQLIKKILRSKNENDYLKKYDNEIKEVLKEVYKKFPILKQEKSDINSTQISKVEMKLEQYTNVLDVFPKHAWSLGDWDKDKAFIEGYNYMNKEYIEQPNSHKGIYYVANNGIEDLAIIKIGSFNENGAVLRTLTGCAKADEETKRLLNFAINDLENNENIKRLQLDYNGYKRCALPQEKMIKEYLEENNHSLFIYGDAGDNTFPKRFTMEFNGILRLEYGNFPYKTKDIEKLKEIHDKALKKFNSMDIEKLDKKSYDAVKNELKSYIEKDVKKLKKSMGPKI